MADVVILETVLARLKNIEKRITGLVAETTNLSKLGKQHDAKLDGLAEDLEPLKGDVLDLLKKMRAANAAINGLKRKAPKKDGKALDDDEDEDGE